MDKKALIGSATAKGGFQNEKDIALKFNNWKSDADSKVWLRQMGYEMNDINSVNAIVLSGYKTDVQVQIRLIIKLSQGICIENLSIKKANTDADYNQVDKRWVDRYKELWNFSCSISTILKKFTGEILPDTLLQNGEISREVYNSLEDKRRFNMNELTLEEREKIITFFTDNRIMIVSDIFKGRDKYPPTWMMVTRYDKTNDVTDWILTPINIAMNFFGGGDVQISPKGSLYIGKITMQRKGGDAGRKTAQMLQFKIHPNLLFDLQNGS